VNRALPARDRGHRSGTARRQSRSRGAVPCAFRLVRRVAHTSERATPPGSYPAARCTWAGNGSGFDRVAALAVLALGGNNIQAELLADRARKEPTHGMGLPARRFHEFLKRRPVRPLEQVEDALGLAAASGFGLRLRGFRRLRGLCGFLRRAGLLARLTLGGRNVARTFANTGLFRRFRLRGRSRRCRFLFSIRCHPISSFCGNHRGHDIHHSGRPRKQGNSAGIAKGDCLAMQADSARQMVLWRCRW
jgi:hypothetical protein